MTDRQSGERQNHHNAKEFQVVRLEDHQIILLVLIDKDVGDKKLIDRNKNIAGYLFFFFFLSYWSKICVPFLPDLLHYSYMLGTYLR